MDGHRNRRGPNPTLIVMGALALLSAVAGSATLRARATEPPAAPVPVAASPEPLIATAREVPANVLPRTAPVPHEALALRASYENLVDRGRQLQDLVMNASVEELEDPNGAYQKGMREYERMWSRYQKRSAELRRRLEARTH